MSDRPAVDSYQLWAARREHGARQISAKAPEFAKHLQQATTRQNYDAAKTGNTRGVKR